jgi:hypothetical protein
MSDSFYKRLRIEYDSMAAFKAAERNEMRRFGMSLVDKGVWKDRDYEDFEEMIKDERVMRFMKMMKKWHEDHENGGM